MKISKTLTASEVKFGLVNISGSDAQTLEDWIEKNPDSFTVTSPLGGSKAKKFTEYKSTTSGNRSTYRLAFSKYIKTLKLGDELVIDISGGTVQLYKSGTSAPSTPSMTITQDPIVTPSVTISPKKPKSKNPIAEIIRTAHTLKPKRLKISDVNWRGIIGGFSSRTNVLIHGHTGTGKSMSAKYASESLGREYFRFDLGASQDAESLFKGNTHAKKGETVYMNSRFIQAITTENAVINLDELTRASNDAQNILMGVTDPDHRKLELDKLDIELEDGQSNIVEVLDSVSFVATANIGARYSTTGSLDDALRDRFLIKIRMPLLSKLEEISLLTELYSDLEKTIISNIAELATSSREMYMSEQIDSPISTRTTVHMGQLILHGFSFKDVLELSVYPDYDDEGGSESGLQKIMVIGRRFV